MAHPAATIDPGTPVAEGGRHRNVHHPNCNGCVFHSLDKQLKNSYYFSHEKTLCVSSLAADCR